MIAVLVGNCNSFSQVLYNNMIDKLEIHKIECTCGRKSCLIRYGYYKRKLKCNDEILTLEIVRLKCSECGRTHAVLPSIVVPYSQIMLQTQLNIIVAYETRSSADCCTLTIDENNIKNVIRNYLNFWREKILSLKITLSDVHKLILLCHAHFRMLFMQIKKTPVNLFMLPT